MASYYKDGKKYAVVYRLKGQPRRYVYGLTEKQAKAAMEKKKLEEELSRAGLYTPDPRDEKVEAAEAKGIETQIMAFEKSILARGKNAQHAQQQAGHVRRLSKLAKITRLSQIFPEPIQAAARSLMDEMGLGPRTANAAIKAYRQFSTWLYAKAGALKNDVLHKRLSTFNEQLDIRRRRRAFEPEEFEQLVLWLQTDKDKFNRTCLSRLDRAMLYQVGVGTGFRQRALLSLAKSSFHVHPKVDAERPYVELAPEFNKNGKPRQQPIRRDLADVLHTWLGTKEDGRVWRPSKSADLSLRFRRDMEQARQAWIEAGKTPAERERRNATTFLAYEYDDGRGKVWCDFHGLRHTGITYVVRGSDLKAAQVWADHSSPLLTSRYAHIGLTDERRSLAALPGPVVPQKWAPAHPPAQSGQGLAENGTTGQVRKIG